MAPYPVPDSGLTYTNCAEFRW